MEKHHNLWSFYLILFCIGISCYSLYSNLTNTWWLIAPPNYILLLISVLGFILGMKGFKDKRNWRTKTRSWLTVTFSSLTSIVLVLSVSLTLLFSFLGANEHIKTESSPDNDYTIEMYRYDAGAAGSFGIRAELNGPLWFKKRIYLQPRTMEADVEWENNHTVSINKRTLNLKKGETHGY